MQATIRFILSNYSLTFFILSVIIASIVLVFKPKPLSKAVIIDVYFSYFLLFSIGIGYFYNFIMHVFFGDLAANFIGWAQSPFQAEVGFASLGFAVVGIMSFWQDISFRCATVIPQAFFLWGAAGGHVYQMVVAHNFAPGNAGIIFWTDIFLPIVGFILLYLQYEHPVLITRDQLNRS